MFFGCGAILHSYLSILTQDGEDGDDKSFDCKSLFLKLNIFLTLCSAIVLSNIEFQPLNLVLDRWRDGRERNTCLRYNTTVTLHLYVEF